MRERGFTLLEALVAIAVVAIGLLGMARLDTHLLEIGGHSKARTQATRLAHAKLTEFRSLATRSDLSSIGSLARASAETLSGYSADRASTTFSRWWDVAGADPSPSRTVNVFVAWRDRFGRERQVSVGTVVAWDEPIRGAGLVGGTQAERLAPRPGGRATAGTGTAAIPSTPPNADGLWVTAGADGRYQLIDATGKVLLSASAPGERFSELRGGVYVDQFDATFASRIDNDSVFVVISESGYCAMQPAKGQVPPNPMLTLPSSGTPRYRYFTYRCYVGAEWYGNIGVVRTGAASTNERVCVGDPAVSYVSPTLKSDNRHPALGTVRTYRGFAGVAPYYTSAGIGARNGGYTVATYDGHDFILTRIGGVPVDADCNASLQRVTSPANPFSTGGHATTWTPVTETAYRYDSNVLALGNPGKAFCLSDSCPEDGSLEPPRPVTIRVTGTVERASASNADRPTLASLGTNSGTCTIAGGTGGNPYTFDCEFTGAGFSAGQWSGELAVTTGAGEFICPGGFAATPAGSTAPPATPAQDAFTFVYASQPIGVAPTLGFRIGKAAADC